MVGLAKNGIYVLAVSLLGGFFSWYFLDAPLSAWLIVGVLMVPLVVVAREIRRGDKMDGGLSKAVMRWLSTPSITAPVILALMIIVGIAAYAVSMLGAYAKMQGKLIEKQEVLLEKHREVLGSTRNPLADGAEGVVLPRKEANRG